MIRNVLEVITAVVVGAILTKESIGKQQQDQGMDRHFAQRTEEANTTWKVIHANASQRARFRPELLVVSTSHPPIAASVFAARVMQAPMRRQGKEKRCGKFAASTEA